MGKKKAAPKRSTKKAAIRSSGKSNADPNQTPLPGMEEIKIAPIETGMKKLLEVKKQRRALKEELDEVTIKLAGLLKKHEVGSYKCMGKEIFLEPGSPVLKIKTAKGQGQ